MKRTIKLMCAAAVAAVIAPIAALAMAEPPSVTSEAILWLDAAMPSTLTIDVIGRVTNWTSRVGANYAKTPASGLTCPVFDAMTYGMPTVDLGATGSNRDLAIATRITNARTVVMVVKIEANENAFWLGDYTNYHFQRGSGGAYRPPASVAACRIQKVWDGLDEVTDIYSEVPDSSKFNIVTMQLSNNSAIDSLTKDRNQAGRNGGKQLSELLVFSRNLTDAEREAVVEYLDEKWNEKDLGDVGISVARTDSATEFSADGGETWQTSLAFDRPAVSSVVTIMVRNQSTQGCFFDWGSLPPDTRFGDRCHSSITFRVPVGGASIACASIAPGAVNTWTGGSGDFEDAANWSLGRVPCYVDSVVIGNAADGTVTNTVTVAKAFEIGSLSIGDSSPGCATLFLKNGLSTNVVAGAVTVNARGTIDHYGPSDNLYHLNLEVGGNMTINEGGLVDARGRGFGESRGVTSTGAIGAGVTKGCHGGRGSGAAYCYGCIRHPSFPGMGGTLRKGAPEFVLYRYGCGGGVVYLGVTGNLVVNGEISADAGEEHDQMQAAGSILLKCAAISGSGRIAANATRDRGTYGGSGGGRIAIQQSTAQNFSYQGLLGTAGGPEFERTYDYYRPSFNNTYGHPTYKYFGSSYAAGTIYIESAGDSAGRGTLLVKGCNANNTLQAGYTDISALVSDAQEPFGDVIVTNGARVMIRSGCTLRVSRKLDVRGGELIQEDETAVLELVGDDDFVYLGSNTLYNVKCTVPGKKLSFGAPDTLSKLVIPAGGSLVLKGAEGNPVSLLPTDPAEEWRIDVDADVSQDISHVAVSNCNASAGTGILAIESTDLGGNTKWSFSAAIVPGVTNEWTGAVSADWADGGNWSLARQVQATDVAYIPAGPAVQPSILSGTMSLNELVVESGASLTLAGECDIMVTNRFTCAGALVFADKEKLRFTGAADFTGATVTRGSGRLYIAGEGAQTVNLAGKSFYKVIVRRPGGSLALNGGFTAHELWCNATAVQSIAVEQGTTIAADEMYVNGLVGSEQRLTVGSSVPGSKWYLNATALDQCFTGVMVSDCDASGGATVVAGASSSNVDGSNVNFDFTTATANWIGGDGYFDDASKWAPAVAPGAATKTTIYAEEGETFTVTVRSAASVASLAVTGTDDSAPTLLANAAVAVAGAAVVRTNATLVLNAYSDLGAAPNTVGGVFHLRSGAVLTHTGPASEENAKVHVAVAGDMLVEEGAAVDVLGKGYTTGKGPGWYTGKIDSNLTRQGATHGGCGVEYIDQRVPCYGSMFAPFRWGSGTVVHATNNGYGYGGGAAKIIVGGTLRLDGSICADGNYEYDTSAAGGSVFLDAGVLSGAGRISAAPGTVGSPGANRRGGGGRIAVYQRSLPALSQFSGTITTSNPRNKVAVVGKVYKLGGAGTYFFSGSGAADDGTELVFLQDYAPSFVTQFPMTNDYVDVTGQTPAQKMLMRAFANVNVTISNAIVSVTNAAAGELWNLGATIRVRDLDLAGTNAYLRLNGCTIEVLDYEHKNGKGWYYGSYEASVAAGMVVLGEANGVPGKIVWRRRGLSVTIK